MRLCVLYTGQLRTIEQTLVYFKENILRNNKDVHVHACLENDKGIPELVLEKYLNTHMGDHLKTISWFDKKSESWKNNVQYNGTNMLQKILSNREIDYYDKLRHLILNGRSMIEYYQLYLAHNNMNDYEFKNDFVYDFVIRIRPDVIFCKPIDFHWLQWSDDDIIKRKMNITELLQKNGIETTDELVNDYFMNTIIHDDLFTNISKIKHLMLYPDEIAFNIDANFLKTGKYILTFRRNLLYIINRHYFTKIPFLGLTYGQYECKWTEKSWWWNAENQFQAMCYFSNLTIFDYETDLESSSISEYNKSNFFNEYDQLRQDPPKLYILIRS